MTQQFYNSTMKMPYLRVSLPDRELEFGINTPITREGGYMDFIGLTNAELEIKSDYIVFQLTLEIGSGMWGNRAFADIIDALVEEPFRTKSQMPDGSTIQSGVWTVQFGWKDGSGDDQLTPEMQMITTQNDMQIQPEAWGTVVLQKTMIMLPTLYLNQTFISQLKSVHEYVSMQTSVAENDAAANIVPIEVFRRLVSDLNGVHTGAQGIPTLDSFIFAGENYFNAGAEEVYSMWLEVPMRNTSSILQITSPDRQDKMSVRSWLISWLRDNDMDLYHIPMRALGPGGPGFVVRYAPVRAERGRVVSYEKSLNGSSRVYRRQWSPALDVYSNTSIVENATFSFIQGEHSAESFKAFDEFVSRARAAQTGEPVLQESTSTDIESKQPETRSMYYQYLKIPHKRCSLTLMGQPKLSIMDVIEVDAANELFTGAYNVESIKHSISKDGFMTQVSCIRLSSSLSNVSNVSAEEL